MAKAILKGGKYGVRQAITTRYHGPTNMRGSRISATSGSGHRFVMHYDDALDNAQNHAKAAMALAHKLTWHGNWCQGGTKDGYVFVMC